MAAGRARQRMGRVDVTAKKHDDELAAAESNTNSKPRSKPRKTYAVAFSTW